MENANLINDYIKRVKKFIEKNLTTTVSYKEKFLFSIYKDLFGALFSIKRYSTYPLHDPIETEAIYLEGISWYRKIMEDLCYVILLQSEWGKEEDFELYIKYRRYNYLREIICSEKKTYNIEPEKNSHINEFSYSDVECRNLDREWSKLPKILKSGGKRGEWTLQKIIECRPFHNMETIHKNAVSSASKEEKCLLGINYETVYWLSSYGIHSNPLIPHNLDFTDRKQTDWFFNKQLFLIIHYVLKRIDDNDEMYRKINDNLESFYHDIFVWDHTVWNFIEVNWKIVQVSWIKSSEGWETIISYDYPLTKENYSIPKSRL